MSMSCGLSEEDLAALEAEQALLRLANLARLTIQPCNGTACDDGNACGTSSSCAQDAQANKPSGSWAREETRTRSSMCMKCKAERAVVLVRQREPLCKACLEAGVSGKVRALKTYKLLLPNDHVAIAFSGGHSSQALLANILPMRKDASTQRMERGKIALKLAVIHVDEAAAYGVSAREAADHLAAVQAAAARCGATAAADVAMVVVPLADIFLWDHQNDPANSCRTVQQCSTSTPTSQPLPSSQQAQPQEEADKRRPGETVDGAVGSGNKNCCIDSDHMSGAAEDLQQREARLRALLQSVSDPTGREDLVRHLRCRLLSATATRVGATKLLSGESATALAARVIADTAKGRGYPLPGEIQLVDTRGMAVGGPALLYPMREVTVKEAVFFCRLRGLASAKLPVPVGGGGGGGKAPRGRSINSLAAAFVDGLQASLPSTIFTILRTASALRPFPFNSTDSIAPSPADYHSEGVTTAAAATPAAAARLSIQHSGAASAEGPTPAVAPEAPTFAAEGLRAARPLGKSGVPYGGGLVGQHVACWCALCRAPLSQREREAIAAAASSARVASEGRGARLLSSNGVVKEGGASQLNVERGTSAMEGSGTEDGAAASGGCGELREAAVGCAEVELDAEVEDVDAGAPFCFSCRSQILFTPGHFASVSDRKQVGRTLMDSESAVLPLLPVVLRSSR